MVGVANSLSVSLCFQEEPWTSPETSGSSGIAYNIQKTFNIEYIRAMQELFNRVAQAALESERVARIFRQPSSLPQVSLWAQLQHR